jgi:hypothetical protein
MILSQRHVKANLLTLGADSSSSSTSQLTSFWHFGFVFVLELDQLINHNTRVHSRHDISRFRHLINMAAADATDRDLFMYIDLLRTLFGVPWAPLGPPATPPGSFWQSLVLPLALLGAPLSSLRLPLNHLGIPCGAFLQNP